MSELLHCKRNTSCYSDIYFVCVKRIKDKRVRKSKNGSWSSSSCPSSLKVIDQIINGIRAKSMFELLLTIHSFVLVNKS